jgi:hypothetical protein
LCNFINQIYNNYGIRADLQFLAYHTDCKTNYTQYKITKYFLSFLFRFTVSAIVEYEYQAKQPDELSLVKGAIINNIKIQPGGWWEGTISATGKCGMFPDNFVRVLEPHDQHPVVLR